MLVYRNIATMECVRRLNERMLSFLFEKERKEHEETVKQLMSVIRAKDRMCDHLENGIKERKAAYDLLSSKYQRALSKLSEYIETDERRRRTECPDGNARGGSGEGRESPC